jgi:hypothetical protein
MTTEPTDDSSLARPSAVHLSLPSAAPRARDSPSLPKKKDQYFYRDEASSTTVGPYDLSTLHLWWSYGLIPDSLQISEGQSSSSMPVGDLLRAKGLAHQPLEDRNEWFLWADQRNPFHAMTARLANRFASRHQKATAPALSIVSQAHPLTRTRFTEFDDFLEQLPPIPLDIKLLRLNEFAEPFALWIWRTLANLNAPVSPDEVKALLLEADPDRARAFFLRHMRVEKDALFVFGHYNQWRLFIPVFDVREEQ